MTLLFVVYATVEDQVPVLLASFTDPEQARQLVTRMNATVNAVKAQKDAVLHAMCFPGSGSPTEKAQALKALKMTFHVGEVPLVEPNQEAEEVMAAHRNRRAMRLVGELPKG